MSDTVNENNEELLEPVKAYNEVYAEQVKVEAERVFDELAGKVETPIELNRMTIKELKKLKAELNALSRRSGTLGAWRIFCIIMIILLGIATGVVIFLGIKQSISLALAIVLPIVFVLMIVGLFLIIFLVINKKKKNIDKRIKEIEPQIEAKTHEAAEQMAPLNARFDYNMAQKIIGNVIPLIKLDKYFDGAKEAALEEQYGLMDNTDENYSTVCVQSGSILGNPFIIQKAKAHKIINVTYSGSITITYTVTTRDSKGNLQTSIRTQVLTATVSKPAPDYHYETNLIYGNTAAPKLVFSREPQNMSGKSEKAIRKFVDVKTKEFQKAVENSTRKGGNLTCIGNYDFEALFHAWNRNNEVQFRLLFTPLAQRNLTKYLTGTDGYGDDFYFFKNNMINMIMSRHSQKFDYSGDPSRFMTIEYDYSKRLFVEYVCEFFKNFYFDLVPLISIPLYQQNKSLEFIYGEDAPTNYSSYEHEVIVNTLDPKEIQEPTTTTDVMIKTKPIRKDGKSDKIEVIARSYRGEPRTDYVHKMGKDGFMHTIPVDWVEYIPVERTSVVEVKRLNSSRFDFINKIKDNYMSRISNGGVYAFRNSIIAFFANNNYSNKDDEEIGSYFTEGE